MLTIPLIADTVIIMQAGSNIMVVNTDLGRTLAPQPTDSLRTSLQAVRVGGLFLNYKICAKCKQEKHLTLFSKHKCKKDGLQTWCKDCRAVAASIYERTSKCKLQRKRYKQSPQRRLISKAIDAKRRPLFPDRIKVANYLYRVIKKGFIMPAADLLCIRCISPAHCWHHHLGYDMKHALDVLPMCRSCHIAEHKSLAAGVPLATPPQPGGVHY